MCCRFPAVTQNSTPSVPYPEKGMGNELTRVEAVSSLTMIHICRRDSHHLLCSQWMRPQAMRCLRSCMATTMKSTSQSLSLALLAGGMAPSCLLFQFFPWFPSNPYTASSQRWRQTCLWIHGRRTIAFAATVSGIAVAKQRQDDHPSTLGNLQPCVQCPWDSNGVYIVLLGSVA